MFASEVSPHRCQLYTVMRTDLRDYSRTLLTYPPSDYQTAVRRAQYYQGTFDPKFERYDYRVCSCS